ncbi:MAG: hypothetical protein LBN22_06140 [Clostridiales Family XIII bacterium]|jgi:hypothetical protein|nr:hypothetical protein [Clostridiales Family XIII bacterium]
MARERSTLLSNSYESAADRQARELRRQKREERKAQVLEKERRKHLQLQVANEKVKKSDAAVVTFADKAVMITAVSIIAIALFSVVFISACCATIQADINTNRHAVLSLTDDINSLKVKIEMKRNLHNVRAMATGELQMHIPTDEQVVFLGDNIEVPDGFADMIKGKVYAAPVG